MRKLAELRAKLDGLKKRGLAIIDAADQEAREFTAAEATEYDQIEADVRATQAEIAAVEQLTERRRAMQAIEGSTALSGTGAQVHDQNPARTYGFKEIGEFVFAVHSASRKSGAVIDPRLHAAPTNVHQGGAASGEGYEVPPEYRDRIFEVVSATDEFGALVDEEPTSKREVKTIADETTPWGATGVLAKWRSEGTQMTPSKLVTDPRTIPLHELYAFVLATEELLEDAPRLSQRITTKAGQAIAWKKNEAMVYGTGAGQPLGWMSSAALVTIAKEGSQAADTIAVENVLKMYARLLVLPGDAPFWMVNRNCVPQLMTMKVGDMPIWMPPNGIAGAPGGFLLGYPVRFSEHAKTLGDKGDIQLVSPKGYYALRRESGPSFAQSMHLYFDYAIEAFRWTFRFGGQPHLSAPVAPAHGTDTKSHFVTLAERA